MNLSGGNQEQAKQIINEITRHADRLYDLLQPGMVIEVTIPENESILVPGSMPRLKRLLIVRPYMHIELQTKPDEGGRHERDFGKN